MTQTCNLGYVITAKGLSALFQPVGDLSSSLLEMELYFVPELLNTG